MLRTITAALFLLCVVPGLMLAGVDSKGFAPAPADPDTSAPDAWGYTWVRSNEPGGPTFNWVDITTRGTLVSGLGDDNFVGPFPMQFQFPYYWYSVDRFYVGSNGYINFSAPGNFAPPFAQLPNTTAPNDMLAICVGDLVLSGQAGAGGQVYYWTNGSDSMVVSFINVTEWEQTINPNTRHTFQVVLNKADSSIIYQYGRQEGRYNSTNNTRLCIGIENATGQIGLNYVYSTAPPHALLPDSGIAIKFKRTVNTGLSITDAGIVGGLNVGNIGKVAIQGTAQTVECIAKNFGTATLSNVRITYQISRGLETYRDTVFIPSMAAASEQTVVFPRQFTPTTTGSYTARFDAFVAGDVGPGNNAKVAEIYSAPFAVGQSTRIQFEAGTASGSINWIGGGGMGVMFDAPLYPVKIETVWIQVSAITANPMLVQVLDGSTGAPGTVLAETSITAVVGLNAVNLSGRNIVINSGRWFVGGRGQMAFTYETTAPISYRSWEYTGGWAPYRSGDLQDCIIRCSVRPMTPVASCNTYASQWSPPTTYPDVPAATYFQAAEWLGDTLFVQAPTTAGGGATTVHKYTSTGGWTAGVPLPATKVGGTLTKAGNKLYYIGGGATTITTGSTDVYEFNPATQGWTSLAPLPVALSGHKAVAWGDSVIFVVGGPYTGSGTNLDVHYYRIASNTWGTIAASLPAGQGRRTFAAGISGNKIIISSGFNTAFLKTTWVGTINSATSITWTAAPDVPTIYAGLSRPGGTVYGDKFYIVCGERAGAGGYYDTTHVYSISGNTWTHIINNKPIKMSNIFNAVTAKCVNDTIRVFVPGGYGNATGGGAGVGHAVFDVIDRGPGLTGVAEQVSNTAQDFRLEQNYPNPFNPSTTIRFSVPATNMVSLKIYDILGREVATLVEGQYTAGTYSYQWQARNLASGIYFYRLQAGNFSETKKLMLLK